MTAVISKGEERKVSTVIRLKLSTVVGLSATPPLVERSGYRCRSYAVTSLLFYFKKILRADYVSLFWH